MLVLLAVGLVPYPAAMKEYDGEFVARHALRGLVEDRRVWMSSNWDGFGWRRFYDASLVENNGRLYFRNELGISDKILTEMGWKPVPSDGKVDVDGGDVLISFSYRDIGGEDHEAVQFYYVFGSLGAHGYEIRVYRSLLMRHVFYQHRWVS